MKHMKKMAGVILTLLLALGLATTAFAAGNGSITISNATVGETYAVYKVFDLTYSGNAVAYTYTKTGDTDALFTALNGQDSPFTLTPTTAANVYNAALKDGKTAAEISGFLAAAEAGLTAAGTKVAAGSTVEFTGLDYGYYYITSSLGTVVTLDNVKPDVTVIDKNQKPGWDPEDPDNAGGAGEYGKFVASGVTGADGALTAGEYGKTNTAAVSDTVFFKINSYAPKYAGDKLIESYQVVDTLGDGFTYNGDLKVMLGDAVLSAGTDYEASVAGQIITVNVKAGAIANYPPEAHLSITYSAVVDKDAVYDNINHAKMTWKVYPNDENGAPATGEPSYDPNDPTDPANPGKDPSDPSLPQEDQTHTYVFGFDLQKYKESVAEANKLEGARFRLYDAANGGNEIAVVKSADGTYRVAQADEAGVEIEAGTARIFGLAAKTYYLEETVAPNGYNLLTERVAVAISADAATHTDGIMNAPVNVINNTGTLLPSTGGRGTTLFYVLGTILVVAAAVLLVTKKRMSRNKY